MVFVLRNAHHPQLAAQRWAAQTAHLRGRMFLIYLYERRQPCTASPVTAHALKYSIYIVY